MIHHVSVGTNDIAKGRAFYDAVLPILGMALMKADDTAGHYGSGHLVISVQRPIDGAPATVGNGSHIAFDAEDRAMVDAFYAAAMANGGSSDGAPGIRAEYDDHYYGAFVRDPDGNKIEALTFASK
ncbi:VOC family protein [Sphingomonas naphthae]|uniref:VOC family protein n=1 Tax=Sphingomonas naphthae TaxID=1813468 RepID=A0ABY7TNK6_9SPHN|nr:VOC family protein [Sphingomonas naphthae]WCT74823.1 VOC family protein [Sphingomonas naphthae]